MRCGAVAVVRWHGVDLLSKDMRRELAEWRMYLEMRGMRHPLESDGEGRALQRRYSCVAAKVWVADSRWCGATDVT